MAISYVSIGGGSQIATAATMNIPTSIAAGDYLLAWCVNKYPANPPAALSGWTFIGDAQGGLGASGLNSGEVLVSLYVKKALGTETADEVFNISGGNASVARMMAIRPSAGKDIVFQVAYGASNTPTAWSVTTGQSVVLQNGDFIASCSGVNANQVAAVNIAFTNYLFSIAGGGATFGTKNQRTNTGTSAGDDVKIQITTCSITAGSGSGALTYTMDEDRSDTNGPAGVTFIVVAREIERVSIGSTIDLTLSQPTAVIKGGAKFSASTQGLTLSQPSAIIKGAAKISATPQSLVLNHPLSVVRGAAKINPIPQLLTLNQPASLSKGGAKLNPNPQSLTLNQPSAQVRGGARALPSPQGLTLNLPASLVVITGAISVNPEILTLGIPAPNIIGNARIQPSPLSLLLGLPPSLNRGGALSSIDPIGIALGIPSPIISTNSEVTLVQVDSMNLTLNIKQPLIFGDPIIVANKLNVTMQEGKINATLKNHQINSSL